MKISHSLPLWSFTHVRERIFSFLSLIDASSSCSKRLFNMFQVSWGGYIYNLVLAKNLMWILAETGLTYYKAIISKCKCNRPVRPDQTNKPTTVKHITNNSYTKLHHLHFQDRNLSVQQCWCRSHIRILPYFW